MPPHPCWTWDIYIELIYVKKDYIMQIVQLGVYVRTYQHKILHWWGRPLDSSEGLSQLPFKIEKRGRFFLFDSAFLPFYRLFLASPFYLCCLYSSPCCLYTPVRVACAPVRVACASFPVACAPVLVTCNSVRVACTTLHIACAPVLSPVLQALLPVLYSS